MNWLGRVIAKMGGFNGAPTVAGYVGMSGFLDSYMRTPKPSKAQLIALYKQTVYSCASINARAVASVPLRMYVTTSPDQAPVKRWRTRSVETKNLQEITARSHIQKLASVRTAANIEEVLDHPALTLLNAADDYMDGFSLIEYTDLYGEINGTGYWYCERDGLGVPSKIYIVPAHLLTPIKSPTGEVSYYEYNGGAGKVRYELDEIIHFPFPNPRDPYGGEGLSPLEAYFETATMQSKLNSYNHAMLDNRNRPEVLISPKDQVGEPEAERLEKKFQKKFRRGGNGGVLVMESAVDAKILQYSNKDMEMLQVANATKADIANAYDVPISMLDIKDCNRATAEAGHFQHARMALFPRCKRMETRINARYSPMFDGRFFFAFDNPVPDDIITKMAQRKENIGLGVITINEARKEDGMKDVNWGEKPWLSIKTSQPLDDGSRPPPKPAGGSEDPNANNPDDGNAADVEVRKGQLKKPHLSHKEKGGDIIDYTWAKAPRKAGNSGHRRAMPSGDRFEAPVKSIFKKQRAEIMKRINTKAPLPDGDWMDLTAWTDDLAESVNSVIGFYFDKGAKDLIARLNIQGAKWNIANPRVRDAIQAASLKFAESTNKTTSLELKEALNRLRDNIANTLAGDDNTMDQLQKAVGAVFDRADDTRTAMIAKTESARALHGGQVLMAKESGLKIKLKWLCSTNACPECEEISDENEDGVDLGENFKDAAEGDDSGYGDVPYPPAHPNCQCTIQEEVVGEKPDGENDA